MDAVVVAFISGKGGTGKTALSAFVASALAARDKKILLVELSGCLRNMDIVTDTGSDTVYDLHDVLTGKCAPYKAIVKSPHAEGLYVISAPYSGGEVPVSALQQFYDRMKTYFDYILLDVASGLGDAFTAAAAVAQRVVLVLTPDPIALRDGRFLADSLPESVQQVHMLINKVPPGGLPIGGPVQDLDEAIDQVAVPLLGVVPQSNEIFCAAATGKPLPPASLEGRVFAAIASRMEGTDTPLLMR